MGVMDILQHYANPGADTQAAPAHFDEVVRHAPADAVGSGVAEAFRSDQTPAFGQMVSRMFGQSNPQQRAGLLNHLLPAIGPGVLAGMGGGVLSRLLGQRNNAPAQVTPEVAAQVTPEQVEQLATHAREQDPGVVDRLGGFYSAHPDLVKTLGGAALAVTLASIAGRMRSR